MSETFKSMLYAKLDGPSPPRAKLTRPDPDPAAYYAGHFSGIEGKHGWVKVLCPFHDDHNPSLSVSLEHGGFHCFTCGEHGTLIDFHMTSKGLSFPEACRDLEASYGA